MERKWSVIFLTMFVVFVALCACKSSSLEKEMVSPADHAHAKTGETCFICDASKRDPKRLWCVEHSRYEDRCWDCHPELRDDKRLYCNEHGVYEDECPICQPDAAADHSDTGKTNSTSPGKTKPGRTPLSPSTSKLFCNEHQVPEHQCGICQPQLAQSLPVGKSLKVRLPSEHSAELIGLSFIQPVASRTGGASRLQLLGEVRYNSNRRAKIGPLASGVISQISADVGQLVEPDQLLAVINSSSVAQAKAEYLSARVRLSVQRQTMQRQQKLFSEGITSRRALDEAQAEHRLARVAQKLARQRLLNLGFSENELRSLQASSSDLYLRAPFKGTLVARSAVLGEAVDVGAPLFEVADLKQMWVEVALPEQEAAHVRSGTPIEVSVRALKGDPIRGELIWISPILDERTRMIRARGLVPNPDGVLRHGMFAEVTALIQGNPKALLLPAEAIQRIDEHSFVFVRLEPDLFAAQRINVGSALINGQVPVLAGLDANVTVVAGGSFSVKSAFLASRLGAGCTDD